MRREWRITYRNPVGSDEVRYVDPDDYADPEREARAFLDDCLDTGCRNVKLASREVGHWEHDSYHGRENA